jgi:hypothetical protein
MIASIALPGIDNKLMKAYDHEEDKESSPGHDSTLRKLQREVDGRVT